MQSIRGIKYFLYIITNNFFNGSKFEFGENPENQAQNQFFSPDPHVVGDTY